MSESKQTKRTKTYYRKVNTNSGLAAPQKSDQANNHNQVAASSRRPVKARRTPNLTPLEKDEQKLLSRYLDYRFGRGVWFHPVNEQSLLSMLPPKRKSKLLKELYEMGMMAGISDVFILRTTPFQKCRGRVFDGMWVELKRQRGGRLTKMQELWGKTVQHENFYFCVAYGAQDAINKIEKVYGKE